MKHSRRDRSMALAFQLRDIPLFAELTLEEILPVAEISSERSYEAGDTIFEEGAEAHHMYLITAGGVEVLRDGARLATLAAGECFGEMAIVDKTTRSATIRAIEATKVVVTPRDDFADLLDLYPALARGVVTVLVRRLRAANEESAVLDPS